MDQITVAIIGLAGALFGVALQWALTQRTARSERHVELLIEAYQKFIVATAVLAAEARSSGVRSADALSDLISAKQKIAYFASPEVVAALAAFGRTSQMLGEPDADRAFANLLQAMRWSLNLKPVADGDLAQVLFGKDSL